jgi:hypothetical protein
VAYELLHFSKSNARLLGIARKDLKRLRAGIIGGASRLGSDVGEWRYSSMSTVRLAHGQTIKKTRIIYSLGFNFILGFEGEVPEGSPFGATDALAVLWHQVRHVDGTVLQSVIDRLEKLQSVHPPRLEAPRTAPKSNDELT